MDFLKDLALPQSLSHITLMHFVLVLVFVLFIPYLGTLIGGSILSVYFNFKSKKEEKSKFSKTAKELIDLPFTNLYLPFVLGILPFFACCLIYAQLLQGTDSISVGLMFFAWLVFIAAVVLLYIYKYKLNLKLLFESLEFEKNSKANDELKRFSQDNFQSYGQMGIFGTIFLLMSVFVFSAGLFNSLDPDLWKSTTTVFHTFIQYEVWIRFIHLLTLSFTITGASQLYFFFFGKENNSKDENSIFIKNYFLRFTLIFALIQPIMIFLDILILPQASLSIAVFTLTVLSILLVFLITHFCYAMIKEAHTKFVTFVFYSILGVFCLLLVKEAHTLRNATNEQSVKLAANFQKYEDELKSKLGINLVVFSGEDLFVGKCSACHRFDLNLTGPAYNSVLPKYLDKKDALVKYILNPVKVDPAFPPMPSQGLKPAEAETVADYLLTTYKGEVDRK